MILSIEDYKKYLPSNTIADAGKFEAFEKLALVKYFPRYLGKTLVANLLSDDPDEELTDIVKPALANLTYLESIPFFNVTLTSTGFGIVSNQNIAPASMDRVNALKDACLSAANEGINQILAYLELNDDSINTEGSGSGGITGDWNRYSLNPGHLITDTEDFISASNINITRMEFVDIKTIANNIERTKFHEIFSLEFINDLIEGEDEIIKPLIKTSLAFFAFYHYNRDINKNMVNDEYIKQAKKILASALSYLKNHLSTYPKYATYGNSAPYNNASLENESSSFYIGGITG